MTKRQKAFYESGLFLKGMQHAIDIAENRERGVTVLQAIKRENNRIILHREQASQ